jgi:hypothetical protein
MYDFFLVPKCAWAAWIAWLVMRSSPQLHGSTSSFSPPTLPSHGAIALDISTCTSPRGILQNAEINMGSMLCALSASLTHSLVFSLDCFSYYPNNKCSTTNISINLHAMTGRREYCCESRALSSTRPDNKVLDLLRSSIMVFSTHALHIWTT